MKPLNLAIYALMGLMGLVIVTQPFTAMGDKMGLGYGDLLNGGAAMGLLLLVGIIAFAAKARKAK